MLSKKGLRKITQVAMLFVRELMREAGHPLFHPEVALSPGRGLLQESSFLAPAKSPRRPLTPPDVLCKSGGRLGEAINKAPPCPEGSDADWKSG